MGLDGRDRAGPNRKELKGQIEGMGMEEMDGKRQEVKGQDEMVKDGKERELNGKFRYYSSP